ncbi:MAG TPA: GNAT family N-acetyltransferase [Nocardioidaceae bacterium]|nr:GNAT family N-acetyltransferase [Nocardioidaceae bacterium]
MSTQPQLRPLTTTDIPAWNRLLAEVEKVDQTGEHYNEADLAEEMANPDVEIGKDIVGAFVGDDLVGHFTVYPRTAAGELHKVGMDGNVRPDMRGRGIGTLLATAMRRRALEIHAERHPDLTALLMSRGLSGNTAQRQLMADIGLLPERWSFVMRADLSREAKAPALVTEGLELRRYDESLDAAMHEAHNAAFVDHPNFTPWTGSMWKQWVTDSRNFRPQLSFVVVDPAGSDEVVAYVQTNEYDAYYAMTGKREAYVAKVGTRREYRGRGLASTLLSRALAEYRSAGYDEASLDVDSENPTGALGIYERAGFEVESRWTDYAAKVAP